MIQSSLAAALIAFAMLVGLLLRESVFLAPYRNRIWAECGEVLIWFSVLLVLNLFAAIYTVHRKLSLRNTGDKLSHLEKQLRGRTTIVEELTGRILQRK